MCLLFSLLPYRLITTWSEGAEKSSKAYTLMAFALSLKIGAKPLREFKVDELTYVGGGCYGSYFQLNNEPKLGVKFIGAPRGFMSQANRSQEEKVRISESSSTKALAELENLIKLYKLDPGMFPEPGELACIHVEEAGITYYGFTMEHIAMPVADDVDKFQFSISTWMDWIYAALESINVNHSDLHANNILVDPVKGEFKVIDVDPGMCEISSLIHP